MAGNYRRPGGHTDPIRRQDGRVPTEREVLRQAVSRPRKSHRRPRVSVALVLIVLLFAAITVLSAVAIINYDRPQAGRGEEIAGELIGASDSSGEALEPTGTKYVNVAKNAEDVHTGALILVNYQYSYVFPETEERLVSVYEYKTPYYNVAYNYYLIDTDVINRFNDLMRGLYEETGDTCILVNSTYRDLESQEAIYASYVESSGEEYAARYVSNPGNSEHHTGLSLDLTIRYSDGTSVLMKDYENLEILNDICVEYGFVQRYKDNKYDYTHINTEPWHYRYVGVPHSLIMDAYDLCLEEYVEYVRDYTAEGDVLCLSPEGEVYSAPATELPQSGYAVYYVQESESGGAQIPIPEGAEEYEISGNNVDGFIVHVNLGQP